MRYHPIAGAGIRVSEVSFGTWTIGGGWGAVPEVEALEGLRAAMDGGVNFFDTADVYGDGRAERLLAQATRGAARPIHIATKFCRAGDIHDPATYSAQRVTRWCERSLERLEREVIDLYQIHCPPAEVLADGGVFDVLDRLRRDGKIRAYGVSVETLDEGMLCLPGPGRETGVAALQVICNVFRQKPLEQLLPACFGAGVAVLARLPLASGLLTGKFRGDEAFAPDDHRHFNADGQRFNVGETFAGLPFATGAALAREVDWIAADRGSMARAAIRWLLDQPGITCAIPGFRNAAQVKENLAAVAAPPFSAAELERLRVWYRTRVHAQIRGAY